MKHRPQRVSSLIERELSAIIMRELEFENCLVTITGVEVNNKLERAIVKFSVYPSEKLKGVSAILNKSRGRLQFLLGRKINIMPMPRIEFHEDKGLEEAAKVEKALMNK
ncbi:ribosome-binding factor A [Candidatus Wolfebacteria bacterium RIFCSPLOWO2_01_FULL_45_19]|uniref:Ribosome-binding factor A n=1 Tax=Candidatus Wolfebacteria bacterium RIFCSPLOWO2_01_FULL_45_19 TaxID=1802557 RepID=A0A1F8DSH9_9BACT|nr:MAG: Ribosome-binding factor A [Parcubacteria group bacterium GW2011_GWB1_45_9]OGM91580.1 MAG: ribosome-binding factor A [Candidatus Wolfebacteria bacterium RIFCSPLOWO2_01_FULL_45_19]